MKSEQQTTHLGSMIKKKKSQRKQKINQRAFSRAKLFYTDVFSRLPTTVFSLPNSRSNGMKTVHIHK